MMESELSHFSLARRNGGNVLQGAEEIGSSSSPLPSGDSEEGREADDDHSPRVSVSWLLLSAEHRKALTMAGSVWIVCFLSSCAAVAATKNPGTSLMRPTSVPSAAAAVCLFAFLLIPWSLLLWRQLRPKNRAIDIPDIVVTVFIWVFATFAATSVVTARGQDATLALKIGTAIAGLGVIATNGLILVRSVVFVLAAGGVRSAWAWEGTISRIVVMMLFSGTLAISYLGPKVQEVDFYLKELPPAADGYRLCHLSDLHAGPIANSQEVLDIAAKVATLNCSAIVLNGDIMEGSVAERAEEAKKLTALTPLVPDGAYFVPGNHEFYNFEAPGGPRAGAEEWTKWWTLHGFRSLNNSHVQVPLRGSQKWLTLAGVDDTMGSPDINKALTGQQDQGLPTVLLAHRPWPHVEAALKAGVNVQISGHTHGGQLWPIHVLASAASKGYLSGVYAFSEGLVLYVGDGTIGTYVTRLRLFTRAELTVAVFRASSCKTLSGSDCEKFETHESLRIAKVGLGLSWVLLGTVMLSFLVFTVKTLKTLLPDVFSRCRR
eukprot:TRINITY_DN32014_c0_g1_i1.p1 TRINITY_DN32014_c0_g1~~TRINITY_DN32014_c0_g1_i1.p1  ORF type:complete len:546 (-),score=73.72 TRINITY_DN32014_c0_g1_i1:218-1855(-)